MLYFYVYDVDVAKIILLLTTILKLPLLLLHPKSILSSQKTSHIHLSQASHASFISYLKNHNPLLPAPDKIRCHMMTCSTQPQTYFCFLLCTTLSSQAGADDLLLPSALYSLPSQAGTDLLLPSQAGSWYFVS